jgi:hypothetical protein
LFKFTLRSRRWQCAADIRKIMTRSWIPAFHSAMIVVGCAQALMYIGGSIGQALALDGSGPREPVVSAAGAKDRAVASDAFLLDSPVTAPKPAGPSPTMDKKSPQPAGGLVDYIRLHGAATRLQSLNIPEE